MKIQIIGYSGSGKSTLAKELSDFFHLPLLHLDTTKFYGNWQERTTEEQIALTEKFLSEHQEWVIDGNYSQVSPERFSLADVCIFLNFNRFFCYASAKKRYKQYKGNCRESCPCPEKFDFEFKKWILWDGRTRKRRRKHFQNLGQCQKKKMVFKSRKEVNEFLFLLKNHKIHL